MTAILIDPVNSYLKDVINNKSKYEEVDKYPMMATPAPLFLIIASYFLFVKKVGPALMADRKPFTLTKTLVVYNALQVIFSAYLAWRYVSFIINSGPFPSKCYIGDKATREEVLLNIWLYHVAKITELFDTVFFVLRKKYNQVSFLHVYHHSLMMFGTWFFMKYAPSETVTFMGAMNSIVHVVMYTYYGLASLGPHMAKYLTWKKYLTTLQLVQFTVAFFGFVPVLASSECPPSKILASFIITNNIIFLYLFGSFYYKNYIKREVLKQEINNSKTSNRKVCKIQ